MPWIKNKYALAIASSVAAIASVVLISFAAKDKLSDVKTLNAYFSSNDPSINYLIQRRSAFGNKHFSEHIFNLVIANALSSSSRFDDSCFYYLQSVDSLPKGSKMQKSAAFRLSLLGSRKALMHEDGAKKHISEISLGGGQAQVLKYFVWIQEDNNTALEAQLESDKRSPHLSLSDRLHIGYLAKTI